MNATPRPRSLQAAKAGGRCGKSARSRPPLREEVTTTTATDAAITQTLYSRGRGIGRRRASAVFAQVRSKSLLGLRWFAGLDLVPYGVEYIPHRERKPPGARTGMVAGFSEVTR